MTVLLIDDLRSFKQTAGSDVVVARTVQAAFDALEGGSAWDQVWFDHDLGDATGAIEDVMPIVDWLTTRAGTGQRIEISQVIVHTSNPVGRANIERALRTAGYRVVHVRADEYLTA